MNETNASLRNPGLLLVADKIKGAVYGCDQDWYRTRWQRMAGCGPSVASNLLMYLQRREQGGAEPTPADRKACIDLMENVWEHVTPTFRGVNTVELFRCGMESYARSKGLSIRGFALDFPKKGCPRPTLCETVEFIRAGLAQDAPVAFLNLSRGRVANLENWHWVTIAAIAADDARVSATVYDNTRQLSIDLRLWHETTTQGGGFVYFIP